MRFRVLEGCTLLHPDGSVWAMAGDVVDIAVDSKDPAERTAAQRSLRGQHAKVAASPAPKMPEAVVDRALDAAPVQRKVTKKKATKKASPKD